MSNEIESVKSCNSESKAVKQVTELKKAWNLIIDYCSKTTATIDGCDDCIFIDNCLIMQHVCENSKTEVSNEK